MTTHHPLRPTPRVTALASAALAATLLFSGCTAAAPAADETTASTTAASWNTADSMFVLMMLPHHEQALEMSDIILAKDGVDPRVAELATAIADAQGPEIDTMNGWIEEWQLENAANMDHGSHDMDGMLTPEQLEELRVAAPADAQRLFLEQMIGHHEGAITMAETEVAEGVHPGATAMAQTVIDTQSAEIETMRTLLGEL